MFFSLLPSCILHQEASCIPYSLLIWRHPQEAACSRLTLQTQLVASTTTNTDCLSLCTYSQHFATCISNMDPLLGNIHLCSFVLHCYNPQFLPLNLPSASSPDNIFCFLNNCQTQSLCPFNSLGFPQVKNQPFPQLNSQDLFSSSLQALSPWGVPVMYSI